MTPPADPTRWHAMARPAVTVADARRVARREWGMRGPIRELGSNQDRNFRVDTDAGPVVLKIVNPASTSQTVEAQRAALGAVARAGITVARPIGDVVTTRIAGVDLTAHVLSFVAGDSVLDRAQAEGCGHAGRRGRLGRDACLLVGETAGRVVAALGSFRHSGLTSESQWDLRMGTAVLSELAPDLLTRIGPALAVLDTLGPDLPVQTIHGDLTVDNVMVDDAGAAGVIDFGDLTSTWRASELAIALQSVLGRTDDDVDAAVQVVTGFATHVTLSDAELTAVWPMVLLRAAVQGAIEADLAVADADNPYARSRSEQAALDLASGLDAEELAWLIRAAGQQLPIADLPPIFPAVLPLALDVTSPVWDDGAWLHETESWRARFHSRDEVPYATRYGEHRLDRAAPLTPPRTSPVVALGVEVSLPIGTRLPPLPRHVLVDSLDAEHRTTLPWTHVQVCVLDGTPPRFVSARATELWQRLCPDPSVLFGVDLRAPAVDPAPLLARRVAHFPPVQEYYYRTPPRIERGWREYLIDTSANVYVDVVNNVATTGHSHPSVTKAAARQWSLLNTNNRFHYEVTVAFAERLAALAPSGLDQVFLVNSGSEAVDLALRLAITATGRPRMLASREAYHGWTMGADAVTTSLGDNPRSLGTRPDWVELMPAANPVRGAHRGSDAGPRYLRDLDTQLAGTDTSSIAGVILEPVFGNGGGVLLPDGYLAGVFDRVRAIGGVCISDEVQVGYGRLGAHFWGFEQQGAVPDIVTVAKGMGNGQPIGAVITTKAIAEAFAVEGTIFSSAGGSPVSSAVGMAVLDVLESEHLQANAHDTGRRFRAGLLDLARTHSVIGAVHGMGLYQGVELVLDHDTFTPATELAATVCESLLDEGCIVQPIGDYANVLKIKPPLVISAASVDFVVAALDRVLHASTSATRR